MILSDLLERAAKFEFLSVDEGVYLYHHAALTDLMFVADELRKKQVPHGKVTWQIDRNVNTTNVCIANCKFCNFFRIPDPKRETMVYNGAVIACRNPFTFAPESKLTDA